MRDLMKWLVVLTCGFATTPLLAGENCVDESIDYLALDFMAFDQDMDGGWRTIAENPACVAAAADVIEWYRLHKPELSAGMQSSLAWHEGQLRAAAGQTATAIELFKQTFKPAEADFFGWNYYVAATIAFLEQDREALIEQRTKLAALEKPSDFNPTDSEGNPMDIPWPPNLNVVDSFIQCFGKSYREAYGDCKQD